MRHFMSAIGLFLLLAMPAHAQNSTWGVVAKGNWGSVWTSTPLTKIMRNAPVPSAQAKSVRIYAARNEYEPFQIVMTPKDVVGSIRVVPHPLVGPGKATIGAWNVSVKRVEYVNCTEATDDTTKPGLYPDPLPDFEPFAAPAAANSAVWVTVYVSPKTRAGDYKGTIDVIGNGIGKIVIPINLHVWSFTLPSVSRLRTAYGNSMDQAVEYQGASTTDQKRKLTELYNLDFWKHRVAPYSPYAFYDIAATVSDGTVNLNFSAFDQAISKFFPYFNSFMLPHFGMADYNGFGDSADKERIKIDYMREVAEHLVDKGQLAKGYDYITDEPQPDTYGDIVEAAKQVRMADQRIKILLTKKVEDKLIGSVDIWVPIVSDYDEQASKARQSKGEQVWWYLCCGPRHPYPNYFIDYPAIDLRMYHWMTWRFGLNGILYWDTMYWRDNPWTTPMSQPADRSTKWGNGDGHLLYPPTRAKSGMFVGKGPIDSLRWETIRDGIEDYDYFRILQDEMHSASAAKSKTPAYEAAQAALKMVQDCVPSRTDYCKDPAKVEAIRVKIGQAIEGLR